MLLYFAVQQQI